jgi:DNA-binding transcriptional ArsR family regulator
MPSDLTDLLEKTRKAAHSLKALAHETRLLIVCHLSEGEKSVQELESFSGTSQSNISQHLAKMKDRGIVDFRKEGNQVFYRITDSKILGFVKCLQDTFC